MIKKKYWVLVPQEIHLLSTYICDLELIIISTSVNIVCIISPDGSLSVFIAFNAIFTDRTNRSYSPLICGAFSGLNRQIIAYFSFNAIFQFYSAIYVNEQAISKCTARVVFSILNAHVWWVVGEVIWSCVRKWPYSACWERGRFFWIFRYSYCYRLYSSLTGSFSM